jgi:hypothetical protein
VIGRGRGMGWARVVLIICLLGRGGGRSVLVRGGETRVLVRGEEVIGGTREERMMTVGGNENIVGREEGVEMIEIGGEMRVGVSVVEIDIVMREDIDRGRGHGREVHGMKDGREGIREKGIEMMEIRGGGWIRDRC